MVVQWQYSAVMVQQPQKISGAKMMCHLHWRMAVSSDSNSCNRKLQQIQEAAVEQVVTAASANERCQD